MTFCAACGSPIAAEQNTEELGPFAHHEAAARRASERIESGRLDAIEEAAAAAASGDGPAAPSPGPTSEEPTAHFAAPAPSRTSASPPAAPPHANRRPLIITLGVFVALLVAAGAVAAVLLMSGGSNASASYRAKVTAAFGPVIAANRSLSDSLESLHGNDASGAQSATSRAQNASSSARGALNALTPPPDSQQAASEARQALDREDSYLSAVNTGLANPSSPVVSQLQGLAGNLTTSLDAVGVTLSGASQSVGGAETLTTWAQHRAHQPQQQASNGQASNSSGQQPSSGGQQSSSGGLSSNPYTNGRDCGSGLYAGPNTSCDFAQNVRDAYYAAPGTTTTVNVYSPVTGQTYAMFCSPAGAGVTCSGGNDASVAW
jgi:hypothetical protein